MVVIPLIAGVILIAVFTLTKLHYATQSAKQALWFSSLRLCALVRRAYRCKCILTERFNRPTWGNAKSDQSRKT